MPDYEPMNLGPYCNTGTAFADQVTHPALGVHCFHGLPFQIASDPAKCFIGFDPASGQARPITVRINRPARRLLFAHALLESKIRDGGPVGLTVATYRFRWPDGEELGVPIRERFEVSRVPVAGFGQEPFAAVPDSKPRLLPRHEGPWDQMSARQMEVRGASAQSYYLWTWENPRPEAPLESVTLEPGGVKFLVAAITLGHADEAPFARQGTREVKITLPLPEDAAKAFRLEVDVDRGEATFPYALPEASTQAFLGDRHAGWGEAQNEKSGAAYVKVSAIPSATLVVKHDGEELGRANWGALQEKRRVETPRAHLDLVDRGRNWVHVKMLDDETGKPVPCRVHFRSPEGIPYQPDGFHHHVNSNLSTHFMDVGGDLRLGQITYAYIDGTCQGWLPRGEVLVDAARGYEYEPLRTKVEIRPGQRELTLRLKRWTNMNARRWFSGDPHVHAVGLAGAHREAQAEDLNIVNLLATQLGHLFANTEDFTGEPTLSNGGRTIVYCSQENRQHLLGHLSLLGLKRPVLPFCSDGPGEHELAGTLEETMSYWADACRAQGGTVVIPHLPDPNGEPAVLIATGRADAVEMIRFGTFQHNEYYRYLNAGYRLPLVGGTDKMGNAVAVGQYRTYAYIPDEEFGFESWCKAMRAGRTFLSGGPLLEFSVDGKIVGDTLRLPGPGTVEVEARAESVLPIYTLQIVQEGRVVASTDEASGARQLSLKAKVKVEKHSWLAARCGGPGYEMVAHHDVWKRGIFAHTSPIYLAVGGDWWMFDRETANYMLTLIEGGLTHIRTRARQFPHESVTHHHGEDDHAAYLERPFHQAREAIHRRMHELGIPH